MIKSDAFFDIRFDTASVHFRNLNYSLIFKGGGGGGECRNVFVGRRIFFLVLL